MALLHLSASTGAPLAGRIERTNGTRGTFPADCCSSREKPLDGPPPPPAAPTGYDTHGLLDALPTLAQLCCHPDAAVAMLAAACTAELAGLHPAAAAHELLSEPQLGAVADALRGFEPGSPHEELALCLLGIVARAAAQAPEPLIGPSVVSSSRCLLWCGGCMFEYKPDLKPKFVAPCREFAFLNNHLAKNKCPL